MPIEASGGGQAPALQNPETIGPEEARAILSLPDDALAEVFARANAVRRTWHGDEVKICTIINAKSGRCPEDCSFCAQSSRYQTDAEVYELLPVERIVGRAKEMERLGGREFSIVTSGYDVGDPKEMDHVLEAVRRIRSETNLETCGSLGCMTTEGLARLKGAGLENFHHNLETARSFHGEIVKSHTWEEEVASVRAARNLGFQVCSGGIFGMGETLDQRVEFLFQVRDLAPSHFPINFLNPIEGTPLEGRGDLTPLDCLRIIAAARLALPGPMDIFVMGGREVNLKELQPLIFYAGANGMMMGGYLTTPGRKVEEDHRMLASLGLRIAPCSNHRAAPDAKPAALTAGSA